MTTLMKLVLCSSYKAGWMIEFWEGLPNLVQMALKAVTQLQRKKFKKDGIVPVPVLQAMWHLGWLPGYKTPDHGMKILVLTEYLRKGSYKNGQAAEMGSWLYNTIMREEVICRRTFVKKEKMPAMKINYDSKPRTLDYSR